MSVPSLLGLTPVALALGKRAEADSDAYTMALFAPGRPELDGETVDARDGLFVIGAGGPTALCMSSARMRLFKRWENCPAGTPTLVDVAIVNLRTSATASQFIFATKEGQLSYTAPHSGAYPDGAMMGGFQPLIGGPDVLTWYSDGTTASGPRGVYICPLEGDKPASELGKVFVRMGDIKPFGCLDVSGIRIQEGDTSKKAWYY